MSDQSDDDEQFNNFLAFLSPTSNSNNVDSSSNKTGACKFPGRSRWELNFVSEFNVNFLLPSDLSGNLLRQPYIIILM